MVGLEVHRGAVRLGHFFNDRVYTGRHSCRFFVLKKVPKPFGSHIRVELTMDMRFMCGFPFQDEKTPWSYGRGGREWRIRSARIAARAAATLTVRALQYGRHLRGLTPTTDQEAAQRAKRGHGQQARTSNATGKQTRRDARQNPPTSRDATRHPHFFENVVPKPFGSDIRAELTIDMRISRAVFRSMI